MVAAQMFCLGKKICNRFWWLKISLHLSTSKILIFSVRSMSLPTEWETKRKKNSFKITINHIHAVIFTVHSHIPMMWQNICDWPNLVQILDILVDMKCWFVDWSPFLYWVSIKPEFYFVKIFFTWKWKETKQISSLLNCSKKNDVRKKKNSKQIIKRRFNKSGFTILKRSLSNRSIWLSGKIISLILRIWYKFWNVSTVSFIFTKSSSCEYLIKVQWKK